MHVQVESGLFANEIEKSSLEIQYRRLKSLTVTKVCLLNNLHFEINFKLLNIAEQHYHNRFG